MFTAHNMDDVLKDGASVPPASAESTAFKARLTRLYLYYCWLQTSDNLFALLHLSDAVFFCFVMSVYVPACNDIKGSTDLPSYDSHNSPITC